MNQNGEAVPMTYTSVYRVRPGGYLESTGRVEEVVLPYMDLADDDPERAEGLARSWSMTDGMLFGLAFDRLIQIPADGKVKGMGHVKMKLQTLLGDLDLIVIKGKAVDEAQAKKEQPDEVPE